MCYPNSTTPKFVEISICMKEVFFLLFFFAFSLEYVSRKKNQLPAGTPPKLDANSLISSVIASVACSC